MNQGAATATAAATTTSPNPAVHATTNGLAAGERRLLEMIALDRPLTDILNELCRQAETEGSGNRAGH